MMFYFKKQIVDFRCISDTFFGSNPSIKMKNENYALVKLGDFLSSKTVFQQRALLLSYV